MSVASVHRDGGPAVTDDGAVGDGAMGDGAMDDGVLDDGVTLVTSAAGWSEAAALLHDYVDWMRASAGFEPLEAQPALSIELADVAAAYARSDRRLFLARCDGVAAGTIALRLHHDGSAELKRMYVRPFARGRGLADRLVAAALGEAAAAGAGVVWLETKRGAMDRAIAVYRRHGFRDATGERATLTIDGLLVMERIAGAAPDVALD